MVGNIRLSRRRLLSLAGISLAGLACGTQQTPTQTPKRNLVPKPTDTSKEAVKAWVDGNLEIMRERRPECVVDDVDKDIKNLIDTGTALTLSGKKEGGSGKTVESVADNHLRETAREISETMPGRLDREERMRREYIWVAQVVSEERKGLELDKESNRRLDNIQECAAFKAASIASLEIRRGVER